MGKYSEYDEFDEESDDYVPFWERSEEDFYTDEDWDNIDEIGDYDRVDEV